jgi:hypothetical protein
LKKEKKLLAVQGDLAQRIIEIANKKGQTVYSLTNDILSQAIKAESINRSLNDIVERFRLFEIERNSGAVFATKDTLLYMVGKLYHQEKDVLLKNWLDSGRWYGRYLKVKFNDEEPLDMLEKLLCSCSWDLSEIRISKDGDKLSLTRLSPNDSLEYTELISKFIEGIISSFGYEIKTHDISKGLTVQEFERKEPEDAAIKKVPGKRI